MGCIVYKHSLRTVRYVHVRHHGDVVPAVEVDVEVGVDAGEAAGMTDDAADARTLGDDEAVAVLG